MSHNKERNEKNCLNCNAHVYGRYCHICGQENVNAKQTFGHLVTHFVYDVTHFDGKFFSTLKYLLLRPGFLSKEFLAGRRVSYLDPIRMYVFTSAIFFLLYFSFISSGKIMNETRIVRKQSADSTVTALQKAIKTEDDSAVIKTLQKEINNLKKNENVKFSEDQEDNSGIIKITEDTSKNKGNNNDLFSFFDNLPKTTETYDSLQTALPSQKKDGWFKNKFKTKIITINREHRENPELFSKEVSEKFQHALPQMMFISLPFAALVLQLLYIRRRRQFFYVSHGIFCIHVYIAFYILILIYNLFSGFHHISGWQFFSWLETITVLATIFYFYKAMHNFYAQKRFKTLVKLAMFSFLYLFVFVMIIVCAFIISLLQI